MLLATIIQETFEDLDLIVERGVEGEDGVVRGHSADPEPRQAGLNRNYFKNKQFKRNFENF